MTDAELLERDASRHALLRQYGGVRLPTLPLFTTEDPHTPSDTGFVELIDVMGDDARIAAAARLSYSAGKGKRASDDEGLLRYLMRHRHTTPFETAKITLHLKMPIFVARQLVRHRTASLNEVSGRYSILPDAFYLPPADQVALQSTDNKQGRGEGLEPDVVGAVRDRMHQVASASFEAYRDFDRLGVAKEIARMQLPLSTYTEWWWTFDAHNLFHMLGLRMDPHAQWECRVYANAIAQIVAAWLPVSWQAFLDYRLGARSLSGPEVTALRLLLGQVKTSHPMALDVASVASFLRGAKASEREIRAFFDTVGLESPQK
jgi:thymidylate synthase (FAD)